TDKGRSASLRRTIGSRLIRNERLMAPDRLTVGAPETVERPAWELFARIPFALAEMDQALHPVALAQTMIEIGGEPALVRSQRRGVPFFAVGIIDRYKRRLSTQRESHIASGEIGIDMVAELIDGPPFFIGIRLCDPGASQIRVTAISCENFTSHLSMVPVTGAADPGSGVQESGRWPSPA